MQPVHATKLLSAVNVGDGTLARFVWFSSTDPGIPERRSSSDPGPLPLDMRFVSSLQAIAVAEHIKDEMYAHDRARSRGEVATAPGDEHWDLRRLRVACLLAVLDHRNAVDSEDWALAGQVMAKSSAIVASVRKATAEVARAAEEHRIARRHRELDADEQRAEAKIEALTIKVVEKVRARPGWARSDLVRAFRDRDGADTAIYRAEERGLIVIRNNSHGRGELVYLQ